MFTLLAVATAAVVALAVVILRSGDGSGSNAVSSPLSAGIARQRPASAPFEGLGELNVGIGGRCLRLAVADSLAERVAGLRGHADLGPYDGMLFVFPSDGVVGFTMATVPDALEIVFFDSAGRVVDRMRMAPCPNGTDATCPLYTPKGPFRYALETGAGVVYDGALAVPR